jgi:hypothetical protein
MSRHTKIALSTVGHLNPDRGRERTAAALKPGSEAPLLLTQTVDYPLVT